MNESTVASNFRVRPYRFTDRPVEMRRFFEAVGLQPRTSKDSVAVLHGAAGMVTVHPLATTETTTSVSTSFCLESDDARAAAEALALTGLPARWWHESDERRAKIAGPGLEISVHEPMADPRDCTEHHRDHLPAGVVVDVVAMFFTPYLDHWEDFFHHFGFTTVVIAPGWRELCGHDGSGAIGVHMSQAPPSPPDRCSLSFKTSEPLDAFAIRMRRLGYEVTEEPHDHAPHVTVTDPDGERIEIHPR